MLFYFIVKFWGVVRPDADCGVDGGGRWLRLMLSRLSKTLTDVDMERLFDFLLSVPVYIFIKLNKMNVNRTG